MTESHKPQISSRKRPQQARSTELVKTILEAAIQVLANEGAQRFTTARVAERAGVSVGSIYQYFPNKAAILFRLQSDEWQQTSDMLAAILTDAKVPALARLRQLVHAFIRSECDEAQVRTALNDAAPLYRHAPEAQEAKAAGTRTLQQFLGTTLPKVSAKKRKLVADLITTTLGSVGKRFSEIARTPTEVDAYSEGLADMLCAYVSSLQTTAGE